MDEAIPQPEQQTEVPESVETPIEPQEPAVPITSRFLFVDVAALRAKQLRRGARIRFRSEQGPMPIKPERLAMEEVRRRLVQYTVPLWQRGGRVDASS